MKEIFGFDAFSPNEIAARIESVGVVKARLPILSMIMLGVLAGVFIGLGAMFYVLVSSDLSLSFGIARLLGGLVFSLGLILVIVAGAELFTGNNLLVMAWADGKLTIGEVFRNWIIICLSNFLGASGLAILVYVSKHSDMNGGEVALNYIKIASVKCTISFQQAFFSGILCNIFVCLAVWMAQAGRSIIDKVIVIVFPVSAFVACGFEHSIANMYIVPMAILLKTQHTGVLNVEFISWIGFIKNLVAVILGNLIGGSVFVAMIYYVIYGRPLKTKRK
ncbi:MAG: formate/nitrite transporter family protein [Saprospiraceae bacterium]|nr:formate/nitrite transporter family protein [Saprospiraceae bacterium]MBK9222374.1 formate/nitrite transporter family protein [Saprospiraceae bacterium]MBK9723048.1 formate/nitrite transporter family protein [Saprospiraceae bacterium]